MDAAMLQQQLQAQQQYNAQLEATIAATGRSQQADNANHDVQGLQEDVQHLQMQVTLLQQENADLRALLHQ